MATVSRVLNDYPDVSPATRERVREAIRESRFVPDPAARSLVTGRSHVVGIVLETGPGHPDLLHPFFQEVLVGLRETMGTSGYDLLLFSTPGPDDGGETYLRRMERHRLAGVVLMGAEPQDPMIGEVAGSAFPAMAVDLDLQGGRTGVVTSDNADGAARAARHLIDLGHRRIGLIGGPQDTLPARDRLRGFGEEMERSGVPVPPEYLREGDFYPASGRHEMGALLELPEPPTAVVAASDLMAAGAMGAIVDRGLRVPDDAALVGFDDIQIASLLHPPLTTVRQDKRGLGAAAAEAVVRMIEDPDLRPPAITLPVELVVRESSEGSKGNRSSEGGMPVMTN